MSKLTRELAVSTGLDELSVIRIMQSAPIRYKTYFIPKRSGGTRKISQPAREVKLLQRALVDILLVKLPVHLCAKAYRKNTSIRDNAAVHTTANPILKFDFADFFTSIKRIDWIRYCRATGCLSEEADIALTGDLLFQKQRGIVAPRLAIGAPSSPILSNILMYDFDCIVYNEVLGKNISYTRYADDLTFSSPRAGYLHEVHKIVGDALKNISYPRLALNKNKTTYVTNKYRRVITGLVLANDGRVTIGTEKKRQIRAAVHYALNRRLDQEALSQLSGMLAFVKSVEPEYLTVLRKKYGEEIIRDITKISANNARQRK